MVTNKTYKDGTAIRIIKEIQSYACKNNGNARGRNGTVFMCCREENQWSHHVTVYVLLDNFKAYGPLVVVNGDPTKYMQMRGRRTTHKTANWIARVASSS